MTCLNPKASEAGFRVMSCKCPVCNPQPAKRYQIEVNSWLVDRITNNRKLSYSVIDSWTTHPMGSYDTLAKAQARARTLNSRNGGK